MTDTDEYKEHLVKEIIGNLGEDTTREGLIGTPHRVVKMWKELFRGYNPELKPTITTFENGTDGLTYDQMVLDTGNFYSHCEHHMVPFFGDYWFAYVPHPKGKILGLSKVARVVDYYAAKLQIQERLVREVVDELWNALNHTEHKPLGMALVMKGKHLCKSMRGAKKEGWMTTVELRGVFKDKPEARSEFMSLIK